MNRRKILTGLGGAVITSQSGCLGVNINNTGSDSVRDVGTDNGSEDDILATIASVSIQSEDDETDHTSLDDFGLGIGADVITATATPEIPAQIEVVIENRTDDRLTVRTGDAGSTVPYRQSSAPKPNIFLFRSDTNVERFEDNCWKTDWPEYLDSVKPVTFEPNEVISQKFDVWGYHGDDECLPPGKYEIRQNYNTDNNSIIWKIVLELQP